MSLKDLIKDVSDFAQDSIDSLQEEIALKKEEQQRLREEMNRRINHYQAEIMEKLLQTGHDKAFLTHDSAVIISFTESFYHHLYLPAGNASNSQLNFYPEYDNTMKDISKIFSNFTDQEQFLMKYKDPNEQMLLLSTDNLYFKIIFPENKAFYCLGHLPLNQLYRFNVEEVDQIITFFVNDVPLITASQNDLPSSDLLSLKNYLCRLDTQNFDINPDEIHQFILAKLNPKTIAILQEHLDPEETLVYFAWGLDSMNSNKFIACTNKKIFSYDQEISSNQNFYYHRIRSITTQPSAINLLDLSLSIGINPNELHIKTLDQTEIISILYAREAQKVIEIYQQFAKENPSTQKNSKTQSEDAIALLEKLATLKESGILTEAEFNTKKEEILSRI